MKQKLVLILTGLLLSAVLIGCASGKEKEAAAAPERMDLSSDQTTITVDFISQSNCEFRLDDTSWQDEGTFHDLRPGTEYTVYGRVAETESWAASAPIQKTVSTTKYEALDFELPDYTQERKTYTIANPENKLEFSSDNILFGDNTVFTFSELGRKSIYVRLKETADHYAGKAKELTVTVSVFERGEGTVTRPFAVATAEQFEQIDGIQRHYILLNDIDFGNKTYQSYVAAFGNLDGRNFTIKNIRIQAKAEYSGIFRQAGYIKNLNTENIEIFAKSSDYPKNLFTVSAGILCGRLDGVGINNVERTGIWNCTVTGKIGFHCDEGTAIASLGGIAGIVANATANGAFENCLSSVAIDVYGSNGGNASVTIGGIYASSWVSYGITDCAGLGNITAFCLQGDNRIGGLCGSAGKIRSSYADLDITVSGDKFVAELGGLAGSASSIEDSYALANILSTGGNTQYAGGLVGKATFCTISNCYAVGFISVSQQYNSVYCGGIGGRLEQGTIQNSFVSVNISAEGTQDKYGPGTTPKVHIGPLLAQAGPTIQNSFYDNDTALAATYEGSADHENILINPAEGGTDYDRFLSADWQNALNWPETIWLFEAGNLPQLKLFAKNH